MLQRHRDRCLFTKSSFTSAAGASNSPGSKCPALLLLPLTAPYVLFYNTLEASWADCADRRQSLSFFSVRCASPAQCNTCLLTLKLYRLDGQGEFLWRILLWILHLKVFVWFLLNTQNKPERRHKLQRLGHHRCLRCMFPWRNSWRILPRIFQRIFWPSFGGFFGGLFGGFSRGFCRGFFREFCSLCFTTF